MSASSLVPSGGPLHCRGGDMFWPSPVYFWGIAPPGSMAGLDTSIATLVLSAVVDLSIVPVVALGAAVVVWPPPPVLQAVKAPKSSRQVQQLTTGLLVLIQEDYLKGRTHNSGNLLCTKG